MYESAEEKLDRVLQAQAAQDAKRDAEDSWLHRILDRELRDLKD